ncbi:DUF4179 domain-containing protein, partial [Bacillus sp. B-TM1]
PIVGDIFRFLDNGRTGVYENYKEFSTELNMMRESNGVKVTLNDAIFNGRTVTITYSIESDKDLGENPNVLEFLQIAGFNSTTGISKITKVDDKKYVGMSTATDVDGIKMDAANVKWEIDKIETVDGTQSIKGKWNFAISLLSIAFKEIAKFHFPLIDCVPS